MTHQQKIRRWFKTRKYLTDYQCAYKIGVMNLRSRVSDMNDIVPDKMIRVKNSEGGWSRVMRYKKAEG